VDELRRYLPVTRALAMIVWFNKLPGRLFGIQSLSASSPEVTLIMSRKFLHTTIIITIESGLSMQLRCLIEGCFEPSSHL
jgi:hypothetical protein